MFGKQYLDRHGSDCVIAPSTPGRVSLKHTSRGSNFGVRESSYEGWIYPQVASGGIFMLAIDVYLICSQETDPSGVYAFTGMKCNARIDSLELTLTEDANGNLIPTWTPRSEDVDCFGQVVTASLRQQDPGLLPTTARVYYLPSTTEAKIDGRIVHHCTQTEATDMGGNYDPVYLGLRLKVDSIDDFLLPGVKRLQVSMDLR